jgi:TRAP-type uncharacterized transport system substrate-binding protein
MLKLKLRRISQRDLWLAVLPLFVVLALVFALSWRFIQPAPPERMVMVTGAEDSGDHMFALRYREILARDGVTLELRTSAGSQQNVGLLMDDSSDVDVGFFQGGSAYAANAPNLVSLGALYYQPLWIFYRGPEVRDFPGLHGKKLAIGPEDSGSRALALQLLAVNGVVLPPTELLAHGGQHANDLLLEGAIDGVLMVAPPESALVEQLIRAPGIRLLSLDRAEAYTRRFPDLSRLVLPKGVYDFIGNLPAHDVVMVSPTANLLAKESLDSALGYLLMRAATEIHSGPTLLSKAGEFPAALDSEFPLSDEARRYYQSGPPFLQRYLPYWAAVLVDRIWISLLPVLALALPMIRLIPPVYRWRVRSRIYRWYAKLKEVELDLEDNPTPEKLQALLARLDQIERSVNRLNTPLAYSDNLYMFRQNVNLVRLRVARALAECKSGEA